MLRGLLTKSVPLAGTSMPKQGDTLRIKNAFKNSIIYNICVALQSHTNTYFVKYWLCLIGLPITRSPQ